MDQGGRQRSHNKNASSTSPPPGSSSGGRIVTEPRPPHVSPVHRTLVHRKRVLAKHRSPEVISSPVTGLGFGSSQEVTCRPMVQQSQAHGC
jgi:hypothetical protein